MGSRLGRRVVHFANLPIKLLMPTNTAPSALSSIHEIALKTVPSATKIEIRRVLESLYGFDVDEVRTLNMDGKKKKRGGLLIAKPDYKKAYVTLRTPLSLSPDLFPIRLVEEERIRTKQQSERQSVVEEEEKKKHWLDDGGDVGRVGRGHRGEGRFAEERRPVGRGGGGRRGEGRFAEERRPAGRGGGSSGDRRGGAATVTQGGRFPWSSMRSWSLMQAAQISLHCFSDGSKISGCPGRRADIKINLKT